MKSSPYPRCCGARILHDFGYCMDNPDRYTKNEIRTFLKDEIKSRIDYNDGEGEMAFLVAILNRPQYRKIGDVFLEMGFEIVGEGWNLGSPLRMYLYQRKAE